MQSPPSSGIEWHKGQGGEVPALCIVGIVGLLGLPLHNHFQSSGRLDFLPLAPSVGISPFKNPRACSPVSFTGRSDSCQ
jgi:hypothetical protein